MSSVAPEDYPRSVMATSIFFVIDIAFRRPTCSSLSMGAGSILIAGFVFASDGDLISNLLRTRMREDSIELKGFLESVLSVHRWRAKRRI
jgi:hypothetical protein